MTEDVVAKPQRGRPRDATRDAAIHAATLALLAELGFDRLSIEAIAARAGVSKATVYRRFSGKAAVVAAAVQRHNTDPPPMSDGSSLRDDLLHTLRWLVEQIVLQDTAMLSAVLAGMRSDPVLAETMRKRLRADQAAMAAVALGPAAKRGESMHPEAASRFAEVGPALITHRLLVEGEPCDAAYLEHVVDDVLLPLLRSGGGRREDGGPAGAHRAGGAAVA